MNDLIDEIKTVVIKGNSLAEVLVLPILFVLTVQVTDIKRAIYVSIGAALFILVYRLYKKESVMYVFFGLLGLVITYVSNINDTTVIGLILPDLITDFLLLVASGISLLLGVPLVGFTSHLVRGWPIEWFRHEKVKPAYAETTLLWIGFFALRIGVKYWVYQQSLATVPLLNLLTGWPLTVGLLVITYVFGIWRLRKLGGPSVDEFVNDSPPPWEGQRKGF